MSIVLAALDATPASESVLATALLIARTLDIEVRALHVATDAETPAAVAAAAHVPLSVMAGNPVSAIIEMGEHPEIRFVTLARYGLPARHEAGQTALCVAAQLTKPLIVVPPEEAVRDNLRRVLFPLDGTRGVSAGVRSLIATCQSADIDVIAVHVFEPKTVPRFLDGLQDAAVWCDEFLAQHCAELGVRLITAPGPTASALLQIAHEEDVDVIALGWHQNLSPARSQVVRHLFTKAHRPIALVPLADATNR